jgi:arginase family enzyme
MINSGADIVEVAPAYDNGASHLTSQPGLLGEANGISL